MLRIHTSGSPFERGQQQGNLCRARVRPWLEAVLGDLRTRMGAGDNAEALRRLEPDRRQWQTWLSDIAPAACEELQGIADGLGVDLPEYLAAVFSWEVPGGLQRCTTVGFRDDEGRPVLGKTDDLSRRELGMNILEITEPGEGYRHAQFHFAGSIWTIAGMNERGLAIGMNGLPGADSRRPGLSGLAALHTILPACATVAEAVEHVERIPLIRGGFSLLLGDRTGAMTMIEKTGVGCAVLPPEPGGYLLHTNHILDPELARSNPLQDEPLRTNSLQRFRHASGLLASCERTPDAMHALLSETGGEGAICQTGDAGMYTDFSVILQPVQGTVEYWERDAGPEAAEMIDVVNQWRHQ